MIKLMVVDDHKIMIDGIRSILGSSKEIKLVRTAEDSEEAKDELNDSIDVILIDIDLSAPSYCNTRELSLSASSKPINSSVLHIFVA